MYFCLLRCCFIHFGGALKNASSHPGTWSFGCQWEFPTNASNQLISIHKKRFLRFLVRTRLVQVAHILSLQHFCVFKSRLLAGLSSLSRRKQRNQNLSIFRSVWMHIVAALLVLTSVDATGKGTTGTASKFLPLHSFTRLIHRRNAQ
jgi:hypothetical protein